MLGVGSFSVGLTLPVQNPMSWVEMYRDMKPNVNHGVLMEDGSVYCREPEMSV